MALPVIAVTNESSVLSDDEVRSALPSFQKQVSDDFKAYWNLDCTLIFLPKGEPLTAGYWQIVVLDDSDQAGALGYHELSSVGTPIGKIFAKTDRTYGLNWTVTFSHELLEMLADPWINWCAQGSDGRIYALEVCDAVEADELGYLINEVTVSDFVTPKWYEQTGADRVDFKQHLTSSLKLAPGGYISVYGSDGWTQVSADARLAPARTVPQDGSRRLRRNIPRADWRQSRT